MNRYLRLGLLPMAIALAASLRAEDKAAPAPPPDEAATVRADNRQLTDELAAAWKESERLKADLATAQAASAKSASDSADLQKQLDAAKAQPPPPPAPDAGPAGQVADLQDKLATSLRSFLVIQEENDTLKASVNKFTSDNAALSQQLDAAHASIASLQVQAAATAQIEPLRTELRQSRDEASALATENAQLKTRLAIQPAGPSSLKPAPTRPSEAAAMSAPAAPAEEAAPPAPAPKTYTVVEGDTLTKISRKFYGTSARWEDILRFNRDILKDEKSLAVGSTLKLP